LQNLKNPAIGWVFCICLGSGVFNNGGTASRKRVGRHPEKQRFEVADDETESFQQALNFV